MADSSFDVLVIGSGASGLAAAVSAQRAGARVALAAKGVAAVVQLGQGAGRHPGSLRRGRLAGAARRRRLEVLTRDRRPGARRDPHRRGAVRDPLARGARRRVHARERRLSPRALRRRVAQAPAAGRRPHGTRDHDRAPRERRELRHPDLSQVTARRARTDGERLARALRRPHDRRHDGGPRSGRAVLPSRRGTRRAVDEPSGRDRRGDADRGRPRRRGARLRRIAVPPERRGLAGEHAGLLDSRDDARVRRRPPERRRRGVHGLARASRRGEPGDRRGGREGQRRRDARRPARCLPRHHPDTGKRRERLPAVHVAPVPCGRDRPAA